jgi:hypothetical protein
MSTQYTKINTSGFGKAKRFFISVQRSVLPEELKGESQSLYQPITENIPRVLKALPTKTKELLSLYYILIVKNKLENLPTK